MANYTKRDQRAAETREELAKSRSPIARAKAKPGPPPTLIQEMRRGPGWFWFSCPVCGRRAPRALAGYAIRWGADIPVIDIAKFCACASCGHRGALLQRPSMEGIGSDLMVEPFPAELATRGLEPWISRWLRTQCPAPLLHGRTNEAANG